MGTILFVVFLILATLVVVSPIELDLGYSDYYPDDFHDDDCMFEENK